MNNNLEHPQDRMVDGSKFTNDGVNVDMRNQADSRLAQNQCSHNQSNSQADSMLLGFELQFIKAELQLLTQMEHQIRDYMTSHHIGGMGGGSQQPEKPIVDKPPVDKPPTEKPPVDKPPSEKPPENKPPTEKPPEQKPPTEKPPTEKPPVDTPTNTGGLTNSHLHDLGLNLGKSVYYNDFNGAKGSQPDPRILDTAHISANGGTRQRGDSIHENAIIDKDNSVLDGNGHLQIFPTKERTYDEKGKEWVDYKKGSMVSTNSLDMNLKDHPGGYVVELRAKHPTATGAKFDALWMETDTWAADPAKGQKKGDTLEFDAGEGGGADITVHYPVKNSEGKSEDNYGGGAHPKDLNLEDGQFHTYDVVVTPNAKTGRGDITEYIDGIKRFSGESIVPKDAQMHLQTSLEISPKWTKKIYTGDGGMNSTGAGQLDYLTVTDLKHGF